MSFNRVVSVPALKYLDLGKISIEDLVLVWTPAPANGSQLMFKVFCLVINIVFVEFFFNM